MVDRNLVQRLEADIARVEGRRHLPEVQAYFQREWGGVERYLESQRQRLKIAMSGVPAGTHAPGERFDPVGIPSQWPSVVVKPGDTLPSQVPMDNFEPLGRRARGIPRPPGPDVRRPVPDVGIADVLGGVGEGVRGVGGVFRGIGEGLGKLAPVLIELAPAIVVIFLLYAIGSVFRLRIGIGKG